MRCNTLSSGPWSVRVFPMAVRARRSAAALLLALATFPASGLLAQSAALGPVSSVPGVILFNNGAWSLGWRFRAEVNLTVTHLGWFDDGQNGLAESHSIGLWDNLGTNLLGQVTVNANGNSLEYHYAALGGAVALTAGTSYVIAGTSGTENYAFFNGATPPGGLVVNPNITYIEDVYATSPSLTFPTSVDPTYVGWFGPNFQFTTGSSPVPEPATVGLLATGLLGVGAAARRRRQRA